MHKKAVIFDLDGTIIDSFEVYYADINEIFHRVGLPGVSRDRIKQILKMGKSPWEVLIPQDTPDRGTFINKCREIDGEIFLPLYRKIACLFPEARIVLKLLYEMGLKLGAVTSGWEEEGEIRGLLAKGGVLEFLDTIVTRFDITRLKPAPDPLIECCKRLDVHPIESVYVGDAPTDIQAGRAAKMATIGVLTGVGTRKDFLIEKADAVIENLSKLTAIIIAN